MIIPAILPKSQSELDEKVSSILGSTEFIQIDVCDGVFVPSKTEFFEIPDPKEISCELDLMIHIKETSDLGKYIAMDPVSAVLHLEALADPLASIRVLKNHSISVGLSISNDTPNEFLEKFISEIDFIQLMGISEIGKQGQLFDPRVLEKISYFKSRHPDLPIQVDGSVNEETIQALLDAGATRFVCGSSVFNGNAVENIERLQELVGE